MHKYKSQAWLLGAMALATTAVSAQQSIDLPSITITSERNQNDSYAPSTVAVASKAEVPPLGIPQSVSVITQQRIEDQNLLTIGDALHEVTGVTVSPWDSLTHQYRSRGYIMDVAYDGVPVYGSNGNQEFDLAIYDRVEVLRGPSALFMGAGQGGGLINLVRKRGRDTRGGSVAASTGSWNNHRAVVDVGGPLDAAGRLRSRFVGSWQEQDYFYDVSHKEKWLGYGTLDYLLTPDTLLGITFTHQEDHADSPSMGQPAYTDGRFLDEPRSIHVYPEWNMMGFETTEVALDLEHRFINGWMLKSKLMQRTQDKFWKDSFPSTGVDPDTNLVAQYNRRASDADIQQLGFDIYGTGPLEALGRTHQLTVGYNWNEVFTESRYMSGTPVLDVPVGNPDVVPELEVAYTSGYEEETKQQGVYAQTRISLTDPLTLVLGGRVSDFKREGRYVAPANPTDWTTSAKETGEFTPYGGLVYYLRPNITSYISYSDIFMPQGQRTQNGTRLEPRIGAQWEAGLKGAFFDNNLNASLAIFRTRDSNRAMQDLDNPGFFFSAGEVEVEGWELEVSGKPITNLNLSIGYAYVNSRYLEDSRNEGQPFSLFEPKHSLKSYARYQFTGGALQGAFAGGGLHINSGNDGTSNSPLRSQGGYMVASAQVGYAFAENTSVALIGNNLFDREYYSRVGGLNTYNTVGEPRNFTLLARTAF